MIPKLGYLIAATVPRLGRGAGAFSPAYGAVPMATPNGFAFRKTPRTAPPLQLTVFNLPAAGGTPGFPFTAPLGGVPLGANPYSNPGAGS